MEKWQRGGKLVADSGRRCPIPGRNLWLPFKRHLIIEEPNWEGKVERYGSAFRLLDSGRRPVSVIRRTSQTASKKIEPSVVALVGTAAPACLVLRACVATPRRSRQLARECERPSFLTQIFRPSANSNPSPIAF